MLEIRERKDEPGIYDLVLDGEVIDPGNLEDPSYFLYKHDDDDPEGRVGFEVDINEELLSLIATRHFSDIHTELNPITIDAHEISFINTLIIREMTRQDNGDQFALVFQWLLKLEDWREPFSFGECLDEFELRTKSTTSPLIVLEVRNEIFPNVLRISASIESPQLTIGEEIERCATAIQQLFQEAKDSLRSKRRANSVVVDFPEGIPESVKVPCQQYLLYFVEFLRDLGVEATAEIQQEAGRVLFAVTPTNKEIALDKIRYALGYYISLPSNPLSPLSATDEIATQRLQATIEHYNTQIRLARAEAMAYERTIQAQQTTINNLINAFTMLESARILRPHQEDEDKEDLIPKVLALGKYERDGVEINLAELLRRFRKLFLDTPADDDK
jgi:hypothetical protein